MPKDDNGESLQKSFKFLGNSVKQIWFKEMKERQIFLKDEKIIAAIRGTIESSRMPLRGDRSTYRGVSLGETVLTGVRDGLIGLTNKRVIFYMPKILGRYEFESYDIDQLSSIQFTKGLLKGRIQLTAFNDYKTIKSVDNQEGKTLTDMIHKAMHDMKEKKQIVYEKPSKSKNPNDDPITILKMRLAKGEITKSKYDKLKKELE